jgi:hypothetical protein
MRSTRSFETDMGDTNPYRPGSGSSFIGYVLRLMLSTLYRMKHHYALAYLAAHGFSPLFLLEPPR